MKCQAILRKSARAGQRCPWDATRSCWCKVHDPLIIVPRLHKKRERLVKAIADVDAAIESFKEPEPVFNAS